MPYNINFLEQEGIVEVVSFGQITVEDFINQSKEAIDLALKKNTNLFLSDDSDMVGPVNISVIISLPDFWERFSAPRTNKMALLISKDETLHEDFYFFENVCRNRGWNVKLFGEKEDAIKWLLNIKQAAG